MYRFVVEKLLHKRWLMLSLLVGNILLIMLTCCNPMYRQAALQKMLTSDLTEYLVKKNRNPGMVTTSVTCVRGRENTIVSPVFQDSEVTAAEVKRKMDVPLLMEFTYRESKSRTLLPLLERGDRLTQKTACIGSLTDLENHVSVISGRMYEKTPDKDGVVECIVSQKSLISLNLLVDEVIDVEGLADTDGEPLRVRIVGVFEAADLTDCYWTRTPAGYGNVLFLEENVFLEHVYNVPDNRIPYTTCKTMVFDYQKIKCSQATELIEAAQYFRAEAGKMGATSCEVNFLDTLSGYENRANKVSATMWILQAPMFVLLAAFIYMVSRQMLSMEQNEIAMLQSRGAGKRQIVSVYLLQGAVLSVVSFCVGVPLSYLVCRVLGATNAFMEFVGREAVPIEITGDVLIYGLIAAVFSVLVMVIPVFKFAGVTIIEHKQRLRRRSEPLWQRMFLDVILLALSIYEYYNFSQQKDLILKHVADGASLDPMLFLSSSLFMVSAGLLGIRLLPILTRVVFWLGKRHWKPAAYASFLHVIRTKKKQGFICTFLIITIAMGIFNANTARTINRNVEDSVQYEVGADLVLQEYWQDNESLRKMNSSLKRSYTEPDYDKWQQLMSLGAQSITKVFRDDRASMSIHAQELNDVELMAIDTKGFGETARMKDGVLQEHFYSYLNMISQDPQAILCSQSFADNMGVSVGDTLYFRGSEGGRTSGKVYGFVNAWPSFLTKCDLDGADGTKVKADRYLIVAHFDKIQEDFGILPYEIWMDVADTADATQFVYDYITENKISLLSFKDSRALVTKAQNDTVYQLTNGMLTLNFVVVLVLCAVGFLIYWILSIRSRELLFGVYRAMGMSMSEVLRMLINEHVFISFLSIVMGILVGVITSKLFVPLIELCYRVPNQTLPVEITSSATDFIRLGAVIAGMLLLCILILGRIISKIKISQALKLGEE